VHNLKWISDDCCTVGSLAAPIEWAASPVDLSIDEISRASSPAEWHGLHPLFDTCAQ
jgi:hypothetical protein